MICYRTIEIDRASITDYKLPNYKLLRASEPDGTLSLLWWLGYPPSPFDVALRESLHSRLRTLPATEHFCGDFAAAAALER